MKWGKQNGPPYPLGYDDHSAAEKRKNSKSDLNNYDSNSKSGSKKSGSVKEFAKKHKKGLIIGGITAAAVVGGAALGYKYINSKENGVADLTLTKIFGKETARKEDVDYEHERTWADGTRKTFKYKGDSEGFKKYQEWEHALSSAIGGMKVSEIRRLESSEPK